MLLQLGVAFSQALQVFLQGFTFLLQLGYLTTQLRYCVCVCVCVCGGRENLLVTCSFPSLVPSAADLLPGVPSSSPSPVPSAAPAVSAESSSPQAPIVHGPPPPPTLRAPPHPPGAATTQKEGTKLSYCVYTKCPPNIPTEPGSPEIV